MTHIALVILLITTSLSLGGCFVRKGQGTYLYAWMINATVRPRLRSKAC